jgi:hypothetical protein
MTASEAAVSRECRFVFEGGRQMALSGSFSDSHGEPLIVQTNCSTVERDKSLGRNVNIYWSSNDRRHSIFNDHIRSSTIHYEIGTAVW